MGTNECPRSDAAADPYTRTEISEVLFLEESFRRGFNGEEMARSALCVIKLSGNFLLCAFSFFTLEMPS